LSRRVQLVITTFLVLVAALSAFTQAKRERQPRALAVVDVLANGRARLTPVAILVDGKFYDANLYRATPRPMSMESGILYDVLHEGDKIGTFTIGAAGEANGVWVADGKVKSVTEEKAPSEISTTGKSGSTAKRAADDEDKPPVLRRPDSKPASTPPGNTPTNSAPHADNPSTQPAPTKPAETAKGDDDEGRPTLKRGKPEEKPDTPIDTTTPASRPADTAGAKAGGTAGTKKDEPSALVKETYTAISDASTNEYRPFDYVMSDQDKERFPRDVTGMALEALNHFSSTHSTAGLPAPGPLQDVKLAAYDLDLNNTPTIVLTATKPALARGAKAGAEPAPGLQLYVTVVARTDIYGNIRRLYTHVTDTSHLDTIPRLELIDAVDAEATGRGQLLFRQIGEGSSRSFVLYRVGADQLFPLFEGAAQR
jgi:hypothetical protein